MCVRCVFSRRAFSSCDAVPPQGVSHDASGWRAVARVLRSPLDDLAATLLPSACRLCSEPLLRVSALPVCADCLARFSPQTSPLCQLCGEALSLEDAAASPLCPACQDAPPPFLRAVAFGLYDQDLRAALHLMKFNGLAALSRPLGSLLAQAILSLQTDAPAALTVIAVPLHRGKRRARRFNQSVLLADAALASLRRLRPAWRLTPAHSALVRTRPTLSHFNLSPEERRLNLRGAFAADPALVRGRDILLVDDIYTTGATARECTATLLAAGARSVRVATLARAQVEGRFLRWEPPPNTVPQ